MECILDISSELKKLTENVRKNKEAREKKNEENRQKEMNRKAEKLAKEIIKKLPEKAREVARRGENRLIILERDSLSSSESTEIKKQAMDILEKYLKKTKLEFQRFDSGISNVEHITIYW